MQTTKPALFRWIGIVSLFCVSTCFAVTIDMTFSGVNGASAFGYYVGPYSGLLSGASVPLYCDDFANEVAFGQQWQANLSTITAGSDLSQTRYGGVPDALTQYQEIAWLDSQYSSQAPPQYADIQATIWQFFDPSGAPVPSSNYWLLQARNNYASLDYSNFRVITNQGPVTSTGQVQEFLTVWDPSSFAVRTTDTVPEPGSLILIGTGLAFGAFLLKRWRRSALNRLDS